MIKYYFQSTMSQERRNELTMESTEKDLLKKLDFDDLIATFVTKNVRRTHFQ